MDDIIQWSVNPNSGVWHDMEPWADIFPGLQHVPYDATYYVSSVFFRVKPKFEPGFFRDGNLVSWRINQPGPSWRRVSVTDIEE